MTQHGLDERLPQLTTVINDADSERASPVSVSKFGTFKYIYACESRIILQTHSMDIQFDSINMLCCTILATEALYVQDKN